MTQPDSALRILTTQGEDADLWERSFDRIHARHKDIHFTVGYARAHERTYGCEILLALYAKDDCYILMPFGLRDVGQLPFAAKTALDGPVYDMTSIYSFGGPIARLSDRSTSRQLYCDFQKALERYCAECRIVSQFTAFHPLLANHKDPQETGLVDVRRRKEVVWIDLRKDEHTLFQEMSKHHRRAISQARRRGVVAEPIVADTAGLDVFKDLYFDTMHRVGASARWFFHDSYFYDCVTCLGSDHVSLFHAKKDGRTLASAFVLRSNKIAYYHLSGSRKDFLNLRPNHLLIYELALWAKALGCQQLHLGGGLEPGDSLFRFKAGFSGCRSSFYTASAIYDPQLYRQLCSARDEWDRANGLEPQPTNFFPAYRR